ncbi:MAG: RloB domain-containing protein [Flexilinea sp.]|nr:RloB domain-containing protein [Flexilinea sp.]
MLEMLETKKFTFTVEGETEQWYLEWLKEQINNCINRTYNIAVVPKVEQSPRSFYKKVNAKTTPCVFHLCDMESNEQVHVEKFNKILTEMKEAKTQKRINYVLGYSNFTFELWIILHKKECNRSFVHRSQYLEPINHAFGENFEDLEHFKQEKNFKRCLAKLTLNDVRKAIQRAEKITENNKNIGNIHLQYKGYNFFRENPALSIHEIVKTMMSDCGILFK